MQYILINVKPSEPKRDGLIEYERFTYPDGQPDIRLKTEINRKEGVNITCRIRNPEELFDLMMVADVVNRQSYVDKLVILYLMGGRTDRVLSFDRPFTLKIVSDMINTIKAREVEIMDPHSGRTTDLIENSKGDTIRSYSGIKSAGYMVAVPDEGASGKYNYDIRCSKARDKDTGRLSGFKVEEVRYYPKGSKILLVDDLCDGGGTFLGIHEKLKELEPEEISLAVTHAIQEEGLIKVSKAYDNVYVTNSYRDWQNDDEWKGERPGNVIVSEFKV